MFFTKMDVNIHARPDADSEVIGRITGNTEVPVEGFTGQAKYEDQRLWHKLAGRDGWVAERNGDGSNIFLEWRSPEPPPIIPLTSTESRSGLPAQPANFTHQQLKQAVRDVARTYAANPEEWLRRARLDWINHDLSRKYVGIPLAQLPFFTREIKSTLLTRLARIVKPAPEPQKQEPEKPQPDPEKKEEKPQPDPVKEDKEAEKPQPDPVVITLPQQPVRFTNQNLINAFYNAAEEMGISNGWELVRDARLESIAQDRRGIYSGPAIAELPELSQEIKAAILKHLIDLVDEDEVVVVVDKKEEQKKEEEQPDTSGLYPFSTRGSEFLFKGKPFKFVGVNMRELPWYSFPHSPLTRAAQLHHIDEQLNGARDMRAQVVRFFAPMNVDLNNSPRSDVKDAIKRGKMVLDKMKERNLYALITLTDAKWSGLDVRTPDSTRGPGAYALNMDFYLGGYRNEYLSFVREYVNALGDHPAIFAWAIGNEMQVWPIHQPEVPEANKLIDFFRHVSDEIRQRSPKKMITPGLEAAWHMFVFKAYEQEKYGRKLYALPNIDFATVHTYQAHDNRTNLGHNDELLRKEIDFCRKEWKVPLVIEELGPTGGKNRGDGGAWIGSVLDRTFNMGVSGSMAWGVSYPAVDIGVGDSEAGMHRTPPESNLVGHDFQSMFNAYKRWGQQFWAG